MRRLATSVVVVAACAAAVATAAQAGVTAGAQVTGASQVGACVSGLAAWQVQLVLVVRNTNATPATLVSAAYQVNATSASQGGPLLYAAVVTADGGVPGTVIDASGTVTIPGIVITTSIPCDTTSAQVCVVVSVLDGSQTPQSCADFIAGGTPLPTGSIGLLGLTGVLGAVFLFAQLKAERRGRRERNRRERR